MIWAMAWRSIWRNGRRTLITASALALGVAMMSGMFALTDGMVDRMVRIAAEEYGINPNKYRTQIKEVPHHSLRVFDQIEKKVIKTIEEKGAADSYKYISFRDFYKIGEQVIFEDCLIWRDTDHFSTCGEQHVVQNADWTLMSSLTTNK